MAGDPGTATTADSPYQLPGNNAVSGGTGTAPGVFNPKDPYDLGVLANASVILAQQNTTTTTHQYNYTPGYGPGAIGPGMLAANGVGGDAMGGGDTGLIGTPGNTGALDSGSGQIVTPGSTTTHGVGNVSETFTKYITDWLQTYASPKTRNEFMGIRGALADAGFYGSEPWSTVSGRTAGLWDVTAAKHALTDWRNYVLQTGAPVNFKDWLQSASGVGNGPNAQLKSKPAVTLMDPANIRMAAQNAAMQALGGGLSEDQLNAFVSQFQNEQVANAAKGTEDPYSTSTKLPGEAMAYVQKANPDAYKGNQRQVYVDTLINMLKPGTNSQRPDMTPTPSVT